MTEAIEDELGEAFGLVDDETRLEILWGLWEERIDTDPQEMEPVSFSELRGRVGVEDSGRFNYHLDQLVPRFVEQGEDGYTLTYAGTKVIGAAVSGVYTTAAPSVEFTGGRCPEPGCEGQMEGSYDSGSVTFGCGTCDSRYTLSAPPILAGAHGADENPDVIRAFALTVIQKTARGFCHLCSGPLESSVRGPSGAENDHIFIEHECQECGAVSNTSALLQVFDHPAVVSAMYDAGVDYRRAFFEAPSTEME